MVVIVLMLVSFALVVVIFVGVAVTVQRESERARDIARRGAKELMPSLHFIVSEPLDARIDPQVRLSYEKALSLFLVSDYLQSGDVREVVDQALPPTSYRRERPRSPGSPSG